LTVQRQEAKCASATNVASRAENPEMGKYTMSGEKLPLNFLQFLVICSKKWLP